MFGWIIGHKTLASFKDNEEKDDICVYFSYTPPKFNIAPENNGWKTTFLLGWLIFMGYVCILSIPTSDIPKKNCRVFPLTHSQRPAARENTSLQQISKILQGRSLEFPPFKKASWIPWWIHGTVDFYGKLVGNHTNPRDGMDWTWVKKPLHDNQFKCKINKITVEKRPHSCRRSTRSLRIVEFWCPNTMSRRVCWSPKNGGSWHVTSVSALTWGRP